MVKEISEVHNVIKRRSQLNLYCCGDGHIHSYGDEIAICLLQRFNKLKSDIDIIIYNQDGDFIKMYDGLSWKGDKSDACDLASEILIDGIYGDAEFKERFKSIANMFEGKKLVKL